MELDILFLSIVTRKQKSHNLINIYQNLSIAQFFIWAHIPPIPRAHIAFWACYIAVWKRVPKDALPMSSLDVSEACVHWGD